MFPKNWKKSTYFEELEPSDKLSYLKKLTLSNNEILPDPYAITEGWVNDVSHLPDVAYPDIYSYLIETPSEYTKDKLKAYKSLEAYNFFVSGHVHDVYICDLKPNSFHSIKSEVLPSQRQGERNIPYQVWVVLHAKGWILSGNCKCMSGLGSVCSHVAALLFKLQACTELKLNKVACTSKLCSWNKSRKRAHPAPLKNISFKKPKKEDQLPNVDEPFQGTLKGYTSVDPIKFCTNEHKNMLESLKKAVPDAVVLTSISIWESESSGSDTDTADETDASVLPELLTSFFDPTAINIDNEQQLLNKANKIYNNYLKNSTKNQYNNLIKITTSQSLSKKWMLYRVGRITASNSKKAFTLDISKPALSTIKTIMQYNEHIETKEMKYGKKSEIKALKSYIEEEKISHKDFHVTTTGLHINEKFPFVGASPDGIVSCSCHEKRLLEIKCPFKYKNGLSNTWKSDKNCPVTANQMKTNHEYYFQVQLQMLVTETKQCDFYVWTQSKKKDKSFKITVQKDDTFCENLLSKLEKVFKNVLLPELVTRKLDPDNEKTNKLYCYCHRPSFKPMIGCDSHTCKIEWFHYACVNVVRAPPEKKSWFCPDCIKKQK